mgnify:CR=1 FL=1
MGTWNPPNMSSQLQVYDVVPDCRGWVRIRTSAEQEWYLRMLVLSQSDWLWPLRVGTLSSNLVSCFFQKCRYHSIFVCYPNVSSWHYLGTELASPEVWYIMKWSWYLFGEKSAVFEAWTNVWAPIWGGHIGQKIFWLIFLFFPYSK